MIRIRLWVPEKHRVLIPAIKALYPLASGDKIGKTERHVFPANEGQPQAVYCLVVIEQRRNQNVMQTLYTRHLFEREIVYSVETDSWGTLAYDSQGAPVVEVL